MPTDWLFYWMTLPSGLALIGLATGIPFIIWRLVLGRAYTEIGFKPLVAAYVCAIAGLAAMAFISSHFEFNSRVAQGVLPEAQRWSTVPGWSIYLAVLSLIFVLPLAGLVGTPLSALLLRLRRFTYANIAIATVALWLSLAVLAWVLEVNEWHRTHSFESFFMFLKDLVPSILLIALPFLLSIRWVSHSDRHAET